MKYNVVVCGMQEGIARGEFVAQLAAALQIDARKAEQSLAPGGLIVGRGNDLAKARKLAAALVARHCVVQIVETSTGQSVSFGAEALVASELAPLSEGEPGDAAMNTRIVADRALRVSAVVTAVVFIPLVLVVGIMANDAGTAAGARASLVVLGFGGAIVGWVLLCSCWPSVVSEWLPPSRMLRFVAVKLPSYAAGTAGLFALVSYGILRIRMSAVADPEIAEGTSSYPVANPKPTHSLELSGHLPASLPVQDFVAVYATDIDTAVMKAGPCQRLNTLGPKELWWPQALQVKRVLALDRKNDRYQATAIIDQFLPGTCNWHLKELYYRLGVPGYEFSGPGNGVGQIQYLDETHRAIEQAKGATIYTGRGDLWCGAMLNKAVTPYYPVGCGEWSDWYQRIPGDQRNFVPHEEADSHGIVYVVGEARKVEFNFNDADAPAKEPTDAKRVDEARECEDARFDLWRHEVPGARPDIAEQNGKLRELGIECGQKEGLPNWAIDN